MNKKEIKDTHALLAWVCFTTVTTGKALGNKDLILSSLERNEVNFKYTELEMSIKHLEETFLRQLNINIGQ